MSVKAEPNTKPATPPVAEKPRRIPMSKLSGEQIKTRVDELDAEVSDLVQQTIKNIAPGRGFDHTLIRQMNKAQREKNRLVAARLTALLDMGHPEAKELLTKLMAIPG